MKVHIHTDPYLHIDREMEMKVFILEDDPQRLEWFEDTFGKENIHSAGQVEQAYDMLKTNSYDVIFLDRDLGNPYETGEDLAWAMQEEEMAVDTPVIIHSSNDRGQRIIKRYLDKYKTNVQGIKFNKLASYTKEEIIDIIGVHESQNESMYPQQKHAQTSVVDFLVQNFPQLALGQEIKDENSEAAEALYNIWANEQNQISEKILRKPIAISSQLLDKMQRNGLVRALGDRLEVTSKGSEVIKTMILGDEHSALENKTHKVSYKEAVSHSQKNNLKKMSQQSNKAWWTTYDHNRDI